MWFFPFFWEMASGPSSYPNSYRSEMKSEPELGLLRKRNKMYVRAQAQGSRPYHWDMMPE